MTRKRVVLLAGAGVARERTHASIVDAGAEVVATLDPASASEDDVRRVAPDAVMVILDPAVEQALDRFDGVLGDPAFDVMFEDADVAAKREGWEAARWSRHLDAKLHGHRNVLPRAHGAASPEVPAQVEVRADNGFRKEMDELGHRVAALSDSTVGDLAQLAAPKQGAVVILAGVGGPDAVRQLLGKLPGGFQRPIVLRQRIEGGHYDKLVRQMQRATQLRVVQAQAGDPLQAGTVYVVSEGLDLQAAPAGLVFASVSGNPVFSGMLPSDSALLLLSGADSDLVDAALKLGWAGGLALGQAPENCFDPAASNAFVARGGQAASLAQLPAKLLERWPV